MLPNDIFVQRNDRVLVDEWDFTETTVEIREFFLAILLATLFQETVLLISSIFFLSRSLYVILVQ